ncbi:hypothetical protein HPB49_025344 [Dermacentor silvarum]|uniref:Uncharacterized protein n=1 Tax=Dermacentor silvarum TaxID=543639 RepID=A0ACB8DRN7_DERSI|nr:hypothetical protein HPB49_025344 [Dermacentor silvarum]
MPDNVFRQHFRLRKETVRWLCDEVAEELGGVRSTALSVERQVLYALRFFATGSLQESVGSEETIAVTQPAVSKCVRRVAEAIVHAGTRKTWVHYPRTSEEKAAVKEGFLRRGGNPGVIGCVDGSLIAIIAPEGDNKAAYMCRKGFYALNSMFICDAGMRILAVDALRPGSDHDAHVWRTTWLRRRFPEGHIAKAGEHLIEFGWQSAVSKRMSAKVDSANRPGCGIWENRPNAGALFRTQDNGNKLKSKIIRASWMPLMPKEHAKIIIRPRGGLNIAKTGLTMIGDVLAPEGAPGDALDREGALVQNQDQIPLQGSLGSQRRGSQVRFKSCSRSCSRDRQPEYLPTWADRVRRTPEKVTRGSPPEHDRGHPPARTAEGRYNTAHASMRSVVERCIGLLKSRFRCLQRHRALHYEPDRAANIVAACAVLRNLCLDEGDSAFDEVDDDDSSNSSSDNANGGSLPLVVPRARAARIMYLKGCAARDNAIRLFGTTRQQHQHYLRRVRRRLRRQHHRQQQ